MFRENDFQAMKILIEEDQENNILNALGLFEKKKLIDAQEKLSAESKHSIKPDKRRSELFGIPVSKSKSKLDSRRSLRIHTKSTDEFGNHVPSKFSKIVCPFYSDTEHHEVRNRRKHRTSNRYGSLKGVSIGDKWNTRVECSHAGVHKPTVASIHTGKDGAYSVAISGDFDDDQDNGYCFTYTASVGRDLNGTQINRKNVRTAPQCRNQSTEGANASLIRSIETRNPVRVIRGYKLDSPFAPETGYRYDGLYTVETYWTCVGKSGYLVYKFLMKRCNNQAPAPWHRREPLNRIRIVKIRRKRPKNINAVLNFSGKLTMNEENGDQITTCELSQMQLKLNTDMMSDSVTIESSAVFLNKDCEERLNPSGTLSYQTANVSEDDAEKKSSTDDSNKENSNKVIIKTRWRRSRLSLPIVKNDASLPSESSTEARSRTRQQSRRSSCIDRRSIKRNYTIQRSQPKTPPKIAYFNVSNNQSFKWSLFASAEEIKIFQKYFRNKKTKYNHASDYEGEFRGFERQDSLNKVGLMILGFIINDIEMKQRSK